MQKIGLVLVAIMQSSSLYSMQLSTCYTYGKTKINVTKGSHYDVDGMIDFIVYEKNEQQLLGELFADNWLVGHVQIFRHRTLSLRDKDADSNFYDDSYSSCYNNLIKKSSKDRSLKRLQSKSIRVIEPLIFKSQYSGEYYYYVEKICKGTNGYPVGRKYYGDEAIEEASNDLALCYSEVLTVGSRKLGNKKDKSIAFPALGTAVDFPREKAAFIAIAAILKFVKNNPKAYDRIELFVKKQCEFVLYKALLDYYIV